MFWEHKPKNMRFSENASKTFFECLVLRCVMVFWECSLKSTNNHPTYFSVQLTVVKFLRFYFCRHFAILFNDSLSKPIQQNWWRCSRTCTNLTVARETVRFSDVIFKNDFIAKSIISVCQTCELLLLSSLLFTVTAVEICDWSAFFYTLV